MGIDRVRVFLSYTLTKAGHTETVETVLAAFRETLKEHNFEIVDPIRAPIRENSEISEDVIAGIRQSDTMFVIQYPPVLNTALEPGFAWALGIPIFHWLPEEYRRPSQEKEGLQAYLDYLFEDGKIRLPSDFGDSRYRLFPGDIATNNKSALTFKEQIHTCLNELVNGPLSEHSIHARRSFRDAMSAATKLLRDHASSPALCWVLNSLMRQQQRYLEQDGNKKFVVDESIYPTFLTVLNEHPETAKQVIAVADINSKIEHFWENGGIKHVVGARIFRLPWATFFDETDLERFLSFARDLASNYPVYVTDSDTRETYLRRLRSGISGDFVVLENVVGCYERDDRFNSMKLVIEYDKELSDDLRQEFDRTRSFSVQLDTSSRAEMVRKEWIKKRNIGVWSDHYTGGDHRDARYYENYDKHIRVWIPNYKELCARVGGTIIKHLTPRVLEGKAIVGEIGVGTGAVTEIVARWCDALSKAGFRPLARYVGIDAAEKMCEAGKSAISKFNEHGRFKITCGLDFHGLRSAVERGVKYDLICGSLILHYLLEAPEKAEEWARFITQLDEILSPTGIAIFGGCYFNDSIDKRTEQLAWWERRMKRNGLEDEVIEKFISGNREMCNMPSPECIGAYAGGMFAASFERLDHHSNPFGVLVLERKSKKLL